MADTNVWGEAAEVIDEDRDKYRVPHADFHDSARKT
jgi:hypothetical protein